MLGLTHSYQSKISVIRYIWKCTAQRRHILAQNVEPSSDTRILLSDTGSTDKGVCFKIDFRILTSRTTRWQHQDSRPQKCPLCSRQFVAASRLKSHLRAAHTKVFIFKWLTLQVASLKDNQIFEKEAQQFEQEQCFFIMEVLQVAID